MGGIPAPAEILLGFLSFFFISAAALILNDYFDIESDKINAPERPLPAGLVTERDVVLLSIAVTMLGFITGYLISMEALLVVILVWTVGFLYNWRFKKAGFIGNLMVSFSVGMTFVFGGIVAGKPFETIVWFFAIIVMLVDLGEEIAADAMDIEGDRKAGSRSLALILGRENALKISAVIFSLVVFASILPFLLGWLEWIYLFPILLMDVIILYSTSKLLDSRIVNRRIYIRWIYLSGLVAFLIIIIIRMVM
ncbi:(S)-2,3-di-O-geranylgeranylglyceryl phosphate synthase [Methanosarcina horonobensis HB-1 = JCM 15518]|uniref:(S)-2,3-di-O-geranylgeranylglyceryl phosphate synthase n=1 Tax=Methanosarcina horonobensis HB-1 = JCM 15518 TaxID=1434110 RepID=A0A0E3WTP5_9EURY|nr:(S)-2,3-di-O-geranylgeranylglyceryl phosphate synthase [Methanosarcina horonobensis HB-1 = JCM 15518]